MSLTLGKSFNRSYNKRIRFLDGFYNIGTFFDKKSTFLLFSVDPDFSKSSSYKHNVKINMFKNLESSKFCETFINLHNFRKNTLDISNQFESIKSEYTHDISFVFNESIILSKVKLDEDKTVYDSLNLYGFTMNSYIEEFLFLIAERHSILKRLQKKVVRTSGLQIATKSSIDLLEDYYLESRTAGNIKMEERIKRDEIIKLDEE